MRIKKGKSKIKRLSIIATFGIFALIVGTMAINEFASIKEVTAASDCGGQSGEVRIEGEFISTEGSGASAKGTVRLSGYGTACPKNMSGNILGRRLVAECLQTTNGFYKWDYNTVKTSCSGMKSALGMKQDNVISWTNATSLATGVITGISETTRYDFEGTLTETSTGTSFDSSKPYIDIPNVRASSVLGASCGQEIGEIYYLSTDGKTYACAKGTGYLNAYYTLGVFYCAAYTNNGGTVSNPNNTINPNDGRACSTARIVLKVPFDGTTIITEVDSPESTLMYACYSHDGISITDESTKLADTPISPTDYGEAWCKGEDKTSQSYGIPTTQFLGGQGVLTATDINTTIFRTNSSGDRIFGTWSEYAIVSGGKVNGMGSGAALGYNGGFSNANAFNSASKDGGGNKRGGGLVTANLSNGNNSYKCAYSKMTIYNEECDSSSVGNATDNILTGKLNKSKAQRLKLESWFMPTLQSTQASGGVNTTGTNATRSAYDKDKAYCTNNVNSISEVTLGKNDFYVYCSKYSANPTNTTITGNIIIDETETFDADSVPQVLIFADNVNIAHNVTRIDAWIIATGTVNTCTRRNSSEPNPTDADCAKNQLVVNGPVFANKLTLKRTYTNLDSESFQSGNSFVVKNRDNNPNGCEDDTKTNINTYRDIQGKDGTENWGYKVISKTYDWTGKKEGRFEFIKTQDKPRPYATYDPNDGRAYIKDGGDYVPDNRPKYKETHSEGKDKDGNKITITKCERDYSISTGGWGGYLREYNNTTKKYECVSDNRQIYQKTIWEIVTNYTDSPDEVFNTGTTSNYPEGNATVMKSTYPIEVCFVAEPAEVFNLRADARIWAYSETKKRLGSASVTGLTEVLPYW